MLISYEYGSFASHLQCTNQSKPKPEDPEAARAAPTPVVWALQKVGVPFNRFVHPHPVRCPGFTPRSIKSHQQK